jgi:hypothetical protein
MSRIPNTGSDFFLFFSAVGQIAKPMTSGLKSLGSNIVTMNKAGLEKTRVFLSAYLTIFFVNKGKDTVVHVLFVLKKSCYKRKICIIFTKIKNLKKPKKNIFSGILGGFLGFLGGFFGWVFWVGFLGGFFGWVFWVGFLLPTLEQGGWRADPAGPPGGRPGRQADHRNQQERRTDYQVPYRIVPI